MYFYRISECRLQNYKIFSQQVISVSSEATHTMSNGECVCVVHDLMIFMGNEFLVGDNWKRLFILDRQEYSSPAVGDLVLGLSSNKGGVYSRWSPSNKLIAQSNLYIAQYKQRLHHIICCYRQVTVLPC